MLKLTDPNYFLPLVEALEPHKTLHSGRTKPMVVRGVCTQTGIKDEYVVKFKGAAQMWQGSSLNEIIASFIAIELGFLAPPPAVINISSDFVEIMKQARHDNFMIASKSLGYNFGSVLQNGFQEIIPGQAMPAELKDRLFDMFALDVFIGNPDRRMDKPNFLSNGKDLLIYDHELAFSFTQLLSFARNPRPWLIPETDMEWLCKNYCFCHLKGNEYDFSNFAARLEVINEDFWNKAKTIIPGEWQNEHFDTIKDYLTRIIDNKVQFASELNRVLL